MKYKVSSMKSIKYIFKIYPIHIIFPLNLVTFIPEYIGLCHQTLKFTSSKQLKGRKILFKLV